MNYIQFINKLKEHDDKILFVNELVKIITEEKEHVLDKVDKYKKYIIDGSKSDTSEQRKLKRNFTKELEDKFGNEIKDAEDYDYLGLKYKVDIIKDLDWNEFKELIKHEEDEKERISKKIASQKIEKEDKIEKADIKPDYIKLCKDVKVENLNKEIDEFKESFKKENKLGINEIIRNIRDIYKEINIDNCSVELRKAVNKFETELYNYINKQENINYKCIGLGIIESFKHTYNSQINPLIDKCGREDLEGVKNIINKLLNYIDYKNDDNMINGKTAYLKNKGIVFSDESVKKLLENNNIQNVINNFDLILKYLLYFQ